MHKKLFSGLVPALALAVLSLVSGDLRAQETIVFDGTVSGHGRLTTYGGNGFTGGMQPFTGNQTLVIAGK